MPEATETPTIQGDGIRTFTRVHCPICGGPGTPLYEGLEDRLFGSPGKWNHFQCGAAACWVVWLDPCPIPEDLHLAYQKYFTHGEAQVSARRDGGYRRGLRNLLRLPRGILRMPVRFLEKRYLRRNYSIGWARLEGQGRDLLVVSPGQGGCGFPASLLG